MASSIKEAFGNLTQEQYDELVEQNGYTYKSFIIQVEEEQMIKLEGIKTITKIYFNEMIIKNIYKFNQNYNFEMIDRIMNLYKFYKGCHKPLISKSFAINTAYKETIDKFDEIIQSYITNRGCSKWGVRSRIIRFIIDNIVHDFEVENPEVDLLGLNNKIIEEAEKVPENNKKNILSTSSIKDELPENESTRNKINNTIEVVSDVMGFAKNVNELVKRFKHRELIQDKVDVFVKDLYALTKDIINSQEQNFNK